MSGKNRKKRATKKAPVPAPAKRPAASASDVAESVQRFSTAAKKLAKGIQTAQKKPNPLKVPNVPGERRPSIIEKLTQPPETIAEHIDRLGIEAVAFEYNGKPHIGIPADDADRRFPRKGDVG